MKEEATERMVTLSNVDGDERANIFNYSVDGKFVSVLLTVFG